MKRKAIFVLAASLAVMLLAGCSGRRSSGSSVPAPEVKTWEPTRNIEAVCTSSPGGGSDIFIRTIIDSITKYDLVSRPIMITYQTDVGGNVGDNRVARATDDHLILILNAAGILRWLPSGILTVDDVTPLAVMGLDKQLLVIGKLSTYKTFPEVVAALKAGKTVVFGGSKGDDPLAHQLLIEELAKKEGIDPALAPYVMFDATSDAIVALLGGHLDVAVTKPAASKEFVTAEEIAPIVIFGDTKLAPPFDKTSTITDFGYSNVQVLLWRSISGPKNMTPEAVKYWTEKLEAVFKTPEWQNYLSSNSLTPFFLNAYDAKAYFKQTQDSFRLILGIPE